MADQKFKSKVRLQGGAALPAEATSRALTIDSSGDVKSSAVTTTELGYVAGVTSAIQTQITAAQGDATQALADAAAATSSINAHIADAVDAHDASAISSIPSGNLSATDVQGALNELQSDVDTRIPLSQKAAANGVASLDAGGKVPVSQLPSSLMEFKGTWDASTNTPTLANGTGDNGDVYVASPGGTVDFGAGAITFASGDWVIYNGFIWQKSINSNAVASVFSRTGAVTAQSGDYTASQVTNVPAGSISATTVQAAITELDGDVQAVQSNLTAHLNDTSDAHDASAISVVPTGNLTSTDVQAALIELQTDIDNITVGSPGDLEEAGFSIANNQASAANITGFAFSSSTVRGFKALVTVAVDATADLFETFELVGINKAGNFEMAISAVGDESGVTLSITSGGQVRYTSANYAGFVAGTIKFRAITTTI